MTHTASAPIAIGMLIAAALILLAPQVFADPEPAASATSSAIPLPTIPRPTATALPPADPEASREIDKLLDQLCRIDPEEREAAATALAEQDESMLPAIAARLIALRKEADRDGMERLLEAARKAARRDLKRGKGDDDEEEPKSKERPDGSSALAAEAKPLMDPDNTDWLDYVLQDPSPKKKAYRDIVAVLALGRTCSVIGTTAAARQIINIYTYFGDLFRIDVQRQLARMGDRALPALIEAQYHDSRMVRTWAKRRLDLMGRAIPSEAVRIHDNQALADVLRAYGHAREVDAVRVIVSFANSDRLQVREAAREAIGQIGDPARWQLRDAYKQLMGENPSRRWDWRRTARELFAVYDRARLQEVYELMDQGVDHAKAGRAEEAVKLFDQVLARAPIFERRAEMVPTYLERAKQLREEDRVAAASALRRALIIDPGGDHADQVKSEVALLEAMDLADRGVLDVALLDRALKLDPSNKAARELRDSAEVEVEVRDTTWRRYAAAVAIGVVALAAMVFVALVPRRRRPRPEEEEDKVPPPSTPDDPPPR